MLHCASHFEHTADHTGWLGYVTPLLLAAMGSALRSCPERRENVTLDAPAIRAVATGARLRTGTLPADVVPTLRGCRDEHSPLLAASEPFISSLGSLERTKRGALGEERL